MAVSVFYDQNSLHSGGRVHVFRWGMAGIFLPRLQVRERQHDECDFQQFGV